MSQRRSRRSLGLPAPHAEDQQVQFDDFRRRHSKQNREIIHENISRKSLIQSLQDQITVLQVELLEVRQQNAVLQRRMTAMHEGQERLRDGATVAALDHILAAMPALAALRKALDTQPPPPIPSSVPFNRAVGNPIATRPAAMGQMQVTLGALGEEDEAPSSTPRRRRSMRKSDETYYPSVSTRNSSPLASPSPKRTPRRHRNRRESGLLLPRPATPDSSPDTRQLAQFDDAEDHVEDHFRVWKATPSPPLVEEDAVEAEVTPRSQVRDMAAQLDAVEMGVRTVVIEDKTRSPESALTLSSARRSPDAEADADADGQEGVRTRRARASVSYKEPSLRAKMRKPDGVAVEDLLGLRRLDSGVRRKSALPRSTKLSAFAHDPESGAEGENDLPSPTRPQTLHRPAGPSPGRASASPEQRDEHVKPRATPPKYRTPTDAARDKDHIPRPVSAAGRGKAASSRRVGSVKRDVLKEIGGNEEKPKPAVDAAGRKRRAV